MSPVYQVPGVYVEEIPSERPIQGVGTAVAAFLGFVKKRRKDQKEKVEEEEDRRNSITLITHWGQFRDQFEEIGLRSYLPDAIKGFFDNLGSQCYVVPIPGDITVDADALKPRVKLRSKDNQETLLIQAKENNNQIEVEVAAPEEGQPEGSFTLIIFVKGSEVERFAGVSLSKDKKSNVVSVTQESKWIKVEDLSAKGSLVERMPIVERFQLEPPQAPIKITPASFKGDLDARSGLAGLEAFDDITMVCAPDLMAAYQEGWLKEAEVKAVQGEIVAHCAKMQYRMAILDPLPDLKPKEVETWRKSNLDENKYAALYYPWIKVNNKSIPPCGHIAGIYARVDAERGIHKAPANEVVSGAIDLDWQATADEQKILNPAQVNCIRKFPGRGIRVWGARSLANEFINVRRLLNYIERSLYEGTQWVVFEPNDMDLWERVKRNIRAFLTRLWRDGALMGATADEAFFVVCDRTTMTPDDIDSGRLICLVGIAPVKPAEFVIIRISQWAGGGTEA